jgi:capsular exopolysaccharide synthesis family protein
MENQARSGLLDTNDLKSVLRIVTKNWWILVSFVGVFYLAGYIYAYQLPDIYAAQTSFLLQSNDTYNPSSVVSNNSSAFNYQQTYVSDANEMSVLKSYDLVKKVVDRLNVNVSYYIKGRLRTTELYTGVPYLVSVFELNASFYEKDINFKIIDQNHYQLNYMVGKDLLSQTGTFGDDFVNSNMRIQVIKNGNLSQNYIQELKAMDYHFVIHNPTSLVYKFQGGLKIDNPPFTNVLTVSLKDIIPMRAIAFLDTLANLYIKHTLDNQFEINTNTLFYIDKQLDQVADILNDIEDSMQRYKENRHILDLGQEAQHYFNEYSDFDKQKAEIELKINALNDLEHYIIVERDSTFLPPSLYVLEDPFLVKDAEELYRLQISKNSALSSVTKKNEAVGNAEKEVKRIKEELLTYIGNLRKAYLEQIQNLDSQIGEYISNIKTLPEKQRGLLNIQRRQNVNEKLYDFLLEKRAQNIIEKAAIIPLTKVIETARSMGVVEPDRNKIYYTFSGIGAVLALILIFLRITFYDRIENIQELKLKTHLPILGEILAAPLASDITIAVEDNTKSPLTESFRTLRTNLQYMAVDTLSKVILFTSNGPGEGKTFCSINLAAILAKAERSVLLLEFDLHKPRIYKALNMIADKGISTIVIGKTKIEDCILKTPVSGMDVILCGPVPPNSSELVLSEKVKDIINYGKEHYDYVIVDTPPLGLISDAFVLMRLSDINLFVLNTKFAYKDAVNYVQETVMANKIKNFGFVLNNVKRKKSKYYYNRYNYGYYGGYGYGGYGGYGSYGA